MRALFLRGQPVWWCQLAVWLGVSVASLLDASAEKAEDKDLRALAARVQPEAQIDLVWFEKMETTTTTPVQQGGVPTNIVGRIAESRWGQYPSADLLARRFFAPLVRKTFFKSEERVFASHYLNKRCKETWSFTQELETRHQKEGEHRTSCERDTQDGLGRTPMEDSVEPITAPFDIETRSLLGVYRGSQLISMGRYTESYEANIKSRTQLTFNGPPKKMFGVDLRLDLEEGTLNPVTSTLEFKTIPCSGVMIASVKTDRNCIAKLRLKPTSDATRANMQVLDVTPPPISGKILRYSVTIQSGPYEK